MSWLGWFELTKSMLVQKPYNVNHTIDTFFFYHFMIIKNKNENKNTKTNNNNNNNEEFIFAFKKKLSYACVV